MLNLSLDHLLAIRWRQGHRTLKHPSLPDRFQGFPVLRPECCGGCEACVQACPSGAIRRDGPLSLDLGRCLFCGECASVCPNEAIRFTQEHRLATRRREALVLNGEAFERAQALDKKMKRVFGRSLKLREVSAGGCNACEADVNVLGTVTYDLGRFGIQFVASPRHADGLLITGPVTENMRSALLETYEAIPAPKLVIAVGSCAISGGIFPGHEGVPPLLPVDLFVPGCPPHPWTILDGLLRLLGRMEDQK